MQPNIKNLTEPKRSPTRLEIVLGYGLGSIFHLHGKSIVIGRGDRADIRLESDAVSRVHARILEEQGQWVVRDNASKNGIQVNGTLVSEHRLNHGDIIQVGDFTLRFSNTPLQKATPRSHVSTKRRRKFSISPKLGYGVLGAVVFIVVYKSVPSPKTVTEPTVVVIPNAKAKKANTESSPVVTVEASPQNERPANPEPTTPKAEPVVAQSPTKPTEPANTLTHRDLEIRDGGSLSKEEQVKIYVREGEEYLSHGNFDAAGAMFNYAILVDPRNERAILGIQAVDAQVRTIAALNIPKPDAKPTRDPQMAQTNPEPDPAKKSKKDRRALVGELLKVASAAFKSDRYQKAIDTAEEIREVEIPGETRYLNEAKQIIDRARMAQSEIFDPFMDEADLLFEKGDFQLAREICLEMLNRDDSYTRARDCVSRSDSRLKGGL